MAGVSTHRKGRKYPQYLCSKRWNTKDCNRDCVRADLIESAILQDVRCMFRDEQFMARVWQETTRRLRAEKPSVDREMLSGLLDDFEGVMAAGTNSQKEDLLHRLVKKVLLHDRRTIEI